MAIFTRTQFTNLAQSKTSSIKSFKGFVNEARSFSKSNATTSIFLSHSHNDQDLIEQAITFFRTLSVSVYVDWMDETMPEKPNGLTAVRIKSKIQSNDKFILLARC